MTSPERETTVLKVQSDLLIVINIVAAGAATGIITAEVITVRVRPKEGKPCTHPGATRRD
jgi:hypothetical protein